MSDRCRVTHPIDVNVLGQGSHCIFDVVVRVAVIGYQGLARKIAAREVIEQAKAQDEGHRVVILAGWGWIVDRSIGSKQAISVHCDQTARSPPGPRSI